MKKLPNTKRRTWLPWIRVVPNLHHVLTCAIIYLPLTFNKCWYNNLQVEHYTSCQNILAIEIKQLLIHSTTLSKSYGRHWNAKIETNLLNQEWAWWHRACKAPLKAKRKKKNAHP